MLDLKYISLLLCSGPEWSSWTKDTFLRWTLQPTSSHSGDSSTECAGKQGWSRASMACISIKLACTCGTFLVWLPETHSSGPFWALWQLKPFSSDKTCRRMASSSIPVETQRRAVLRHWGDDVNLISWTLKKTAASLQALKVFYIR